MELYEKLANRTSKRKRIYKHIDRIDMINENDSGKILHPISVEIFPTNKCNSNCSFCAFRNYRNNVSLDKRSFENLITDLIDSGVKSVVFSGGGEPSLHEYLPVAINRLADAGVHIGLITNGLELNTDLKRAITRCSWIRISILTEKKDLYRKLTGKDNNAFEKIIKNINDINKLRRSISNCNLVIGALMLVSEKYTLVSDFYDFIDFSKNSNIDQVFFSEMLDSFGEIKLDRKKLDNHLQRIIEYSKEKKVVTNIKKFVVQKKNEAIKNEKMSDCVFTSLNLYSLIDSNGDLYQCFGEYTNSGHSIGNIKKQKLKEIYLKNSLINKNNKKQCDFCKNINTIKEINLYKNKKIKENCNDIHYNFL